MVRRSGVARPPAMAGEVGRAMRGVSIIPRPATPWLGGGRPRGTGCVPASLRAVLLVGLLAGLASAVELDRIRVALLIDGMAARGADYDPTELNALGVDGLAAVLDYFLPQTAPAEAPPAAADPPADEVLRRLRALDDEEFATREAATAWLIAHARPQRALVAAWGQCDVLERRLRVERVLASWEVRPVERASAYLTGLWAYLEQVHDPPRLALLSRRTRRALEQGLPEGDQLHLLRLCLAGVAHGQHEAACDVLRPLVEHPDVRVATLVVETVGAYKRQPQFVPRLVVDALGSPRPAVVEAALRFLVGSGDTPHREALYAALKALLRHPDESLRFQACLPLIRDFHDAQAWSDVIAQTASADAGRVRTAWNWIGDTRPGGQAPSAELLQVFDRFLADGTPAQRRAAAQALGAYAGPAVVQRLVQLLADREDAIAQHAQTRLRALAQERSVQVQLAHLAREHSDPRVRQRLEALVPPSSAVSPTRWDAAPAEVRSVREGG
jgi:hypothetical protein